MTHLKYKERLIPEQNKPLIAGICMCQLTVVLSIVSFIYLSVAIYMPSRRAFNSGFETTPVTCQTIETTLINNCSWASCGEWCLTKTTGFCPQIHVTVRRNGTDLIMDNCTRNVTNACLEVNNGEMTRFNCNNGTECSALTGLFNCSLGHCANMSERYQCYYKADGINVDSDKDKLKLNGFFECKKSKCTKIKRPFTCDRYCPKILTGNINTFLLHGDSVYTASCQRALAANMADGSNTTRTIEPTEFWTAGTKTREVLLASCQRVIQYGNNSLWGTDCVNGTVLDEKMIPANLMNFTTLWALYDRSNESVDPSEKYLPPQRSLTIYNLSRLYINLDGCVNTLRGECKAFHESHGRDGRNRTGISRFPCYYNTNNSFMAITQFDLDKAWLELVVAIVVPAVLFVISCTALMVITKAVKVGDDAILRCSMCRGVSPPVEVDDEVKLSSRNTLPKISDNNGGAMVL